MASVASQLIEEVTAHAQSDSFEDAREIRADGTYFPNNLCNSLEVHYYSILNHVFETRHHQRPIQPLRRNTING